jgi:hypothetical protein
MNTVILVDKFGIIDKSNYINATEAIRAAKKEIGNAFAIRIYFSDGTSAVWNQIQQSDCLK